MEDVSGKYGEGRKLLSSLTVEDRDPERSSPETDRMVLTPGRRRFAY